MFSRELVDDLRGLNDRLPDDASIVFVHQGSVDQGCGFFERLWPEARAVSDPERELYDAFGLGRGSLRQMFGPSVWRRGLEAFVKGHRIGLPVGDPWVMPGMVLVRDGRVTWRHTFTHAGDHPRLEDVEAALEAVRERALR